MAWLTATRNAVPAIDTTKAGIGVAHRIETGATAHGVGQVVLEGREGRKVGALELGVVSGEPGLEPARPRRSPA